MENTTKNLKENRFQDLTDMAHKLRIHAITMTDLSASG